MLDEKHMRLALELAFKGRGFVEPNPLVGCVIVRGETVIGQGWHRQFGSAHAEINAIESVQNQSQLVGATCYVTLEPCSHVGKTGPCTKALIESGIGRIVVATLDPNPAVSGNGSQQLKEAGVDVSIGLLGDESNIVLGPYLKRITTHKPWIIAKWAMTLDGKIASHQGDSQWISNSQSREVVHQIRGRVDGILVGIGTVIADDPMLNARPKGARVATRIVVDSTARISLDSRLVETAGEFSTLIAVGPRTDEARLVALKEKGCQIFQDASDDPNQRLLALLDHLATLDMTNILVEGGGQILGALHDLGQVDEVHVFIGPKVVGGKESPTPVAGVGKPLMDLATSFSIHHVQQFGDDVYLCGRPIRQAINK